MSAWRVFPRAVCALPFVCLSILCDALTVLILGVSPVARVVILRSGEQYFFIGSGRPRELDMESAFAAARFDLATAYDRERENSQRAETPVQRETA